MKKWSTYSPSIDCIWIQDSGVLAASLSHCFSKFGVLNIRFSREAVTLSLNCKTVGFALFQTESYVNWSIMAWMKQLPSFGVIGWLGDSKKLISCNRWVTWIVALSKFNLEDLIRLEIFLFVAFFPSILLPLVRKVVPFLRNWH